MAATVRQINAIAKKDKSVEARKLSAEERFQRDFALARWIETENSTNGNAPTVALVQSHLSKEVKVPITNGAALIARPPSKVSSKRVLRFRKRRSVTGGRFAAQGHRPLETVHNKVTC